MEYKTTNLYIAAFILTKGGQMSGIERGNGKRFWFVFNDEEDCKELERMFNYTAEDNIDVMVDARKFRDAITNLKEKLYG